MVIFIYCFGNDSEHSPVSWNVLIFLHFLLLQCVFGWHGILQDLNDPFLYYLRLSDQRFLNRCLDHSGCQNLGIFYVCYFMRHVLFIFITISPQPNPKTLFSFQKVWESLPTSEIFLLTCVTSLQDFLHGQLFTSSGSCNRYLFSFTRQYSMIRALYSISKIFVCCFSFLIMSRDFFCERLPLYVFKFRVAVFRALFHNYLTQQL